VLGIKGSELHAERAVGLWPRCLRFHLGVSSNGELAPEEIARLDAVSHETPIYPYWHQKGFDERNPKPTTW